MQKKYLGTGKRYKFSKVPTVQHCGTIVLGTARLCKYLRSKLSFVVYILQIYVLPNL